MIRQITHGIVILAAALTMAGPLASGARAATPVMIRVWLRDPNQDDDLWELRLNGRGVLRNNPPSAGWTHTDVPVEAGSILECSLARIPAQQAGVTDEYEVRFTGLDGQSSPVLRALPHNAPSMGVLPWNGSNPPDPSGLRWRFFVRPNPEAGDVDGTYANSVDPINTINGNVSTEATDLFIPCPGIPLVFHRVYGSQLDRESALGPNWTHTYDWRVITNEIVLSPSQSMVYASLQVGNGGQYRFEREADGMWVAPFADNPFELFGSPDGGYVAQVASSLASRRKPGPTGLRVRLAPEEACAAGLKWRVLETESGWLDSGAFCPLSTGRYTVVFTNLPTWYGTERTVDIRADTTLEIGGRAGMVTNWGFPMAPPRGSSG